MRFRTVLLAVIALVTTAYFYKPQLASYIESFSVPAHPSAKLVESLIKQTKTLVFSKSYCPHSRNAIALLESLDAGATVLQLDQREDGPSIQAYIAQREGHRTVPAVFINRKFIGGASDLVALNNQGELAKLLKK